MKKAVKNNNTKSISIVLLFIVLGILSACGSDFNAGELDSVANAVPNAASNQKGSNNETPDGIPLNEEPKGEIWITVNHVLGHKWLLEYEHATNSTTLKVAIVIWDRDRHELVSVLHGCTYDFPVSNVAGGGDRVRVELNSIKDGIDDCYKQYDPSTTMAAPIVELYPKIQFEIFGRWNQAPSTAESLVAHDSFKLGFEPVNASELQIFFASGAARRQGIDVFSGPIEINPPNDFMGVVNFSFWNSIHDPQIRTTYIEHYGQTGNNPIQPTLKELQGRDNAVEIFLGDADLEITVPNDFDLDYFIVDPKGWGAGGG